MMDCFLTGDMINVQSGLKIVLCTMHPAFSYLLLLFLESG
jgi:hypothetical protein